LRPMAEDVLGRGSLLLQVVCSGKALRTFRYQA
jgi:hypothetical protein